MAFMRTTVEVTQADIDRAMTKNSSRCVVATAIARSIPSASRISVDVQSIRFTLAGERFVYITPYSVSGYVVAFDAGDEIHPFRFQLREDQQVRVRQTKTTEAGKETTKARAKARRKAEAVASAQQTLDGLKEQATDPSLPPPSPTEIKAVKAELARRKESAKTAAEQRDEVIASYAEHRKTAAQDLDKPKAPAQVFKKNERHYGHRALRINQQSATGGA